MASSPNSQFMEELIKFRNNGKFRCLLLFPTKEEYSSYVTFLSGDRRCCFTRKRLANFCVEKISENTVLCHKISKKRIIWVEQCESVFRAYHDRKGHGGRNSTYRKLLKDFHYVPREVLATYIRLCSHCATRRPIPKPVAGIPIYAKGPMDRVQIDCIDMRSVPDGEFKWIVQAKCHFSKFVWGQALPRKETKYICTFLSEIFFTFGPPKLLQCDGGGEFRGNELQVLLSKHFPATRLIRSAPRHPQTNGLIERANGTLERRISGYMTENNRKWASGIQLLIYEINTSMTRTTKQTPHQLLFLRNHNTVVDRVEDIICNDLGTGPGTEEILIENATESESDATDREGGIHTTQEDVSVVSNEGSESDTMEVGSETEVDMSDCEEGSNSGEGSVSEEGEDSGEGGDSEEGDDSREGGDSGEGGDSEEGDDSREGGDSEEGGNSEEESGSNAMEDEEIESEMERFLGDLNGRQPCVLYTKDPPKLWAIAVKSDIGSDRKNFLCFDIVHPLTGTKCYYNNDCILSKGCNIMWPKIHYSQDLGTTIKSVYERLPGFINYLRNRNSQRDKYNQARKEKSILVGDTVGIPIPKVDRSNTCPTVLPCKVLTRTLKGVLKLQCNAGVIDVNLHEDKVAIWTGPNIDFSSAPMTPIKLTTAYRSTTSYSASAVASVCKCKSECTTKRCICKRNKIQCGTKCHPHSTRCINK